MKYLGIFKTDTLISAVNWMSALALPVYMVCMVVVPWIQEGCDWAYVQSVWDRWQTLNAGVLAFIASVIALNISRYHANKQRERQFVAAKAFLPHALSELISYFKQSAKLLREVWVHIENEEIRSPITLETIAPELPRDYQEIFSRCIEQADPDVADYLAKILMRLQIHNARMKDLFASLTQESHMLVLRANVISYMYSLAQLQGAVNKLFPFARGMGEFDKAKLVWEDYYNAFANLDIWVEDFDDLEGFTKRAIERDTIL